MAPVKQFSGHARNWWGLAEPARVVDHLVFAAPRQATSHATESTHREATQRWGVMVRVGRGQTDGNGSENFKGA